MSAETRAAAATFINLYSQSEDVHKGSSGFTPEDNNEAILYGLTFAEQLFPRSAVMLCPRSHPGFTYISTNSEQVMGHSRQTVMSWDIEETFAHVHPDDIVPFKLCLDFITNCGPLDPEAHRFIISFRFRSSQGIYLHLRQEHMAIRTINGTYLFLMVYTNISDEAKFYQVSLRVQKKIRDTFVKVYEYHPRQAQHAITPRQNDIAQLIMKGFSNQEIADRLNVSVFTVKNHKRLLFKKVNVKNSMELASRAKGRILH